MRQKTIDNIKESYEHIKPYLNNKDCTKELREMCKYCENWCGDVHNYENCENMMCFKFYLAFEYLNWSNCF